MNGIQEVDGSIPFSSTNHLIGNLATLEVAFFVAGRGPGKAGLTFDASA